MRRDFSTNEAACPKSFAYLARGEKMFEARARGVLK
jgi:hypothetical protein